MTEDNSTKLTTERESTTQNKAMFLVVFHNKAGNIYESCKAIGISREGYYEWLKKDEVFKTAVKEIKESLVDFAESKLIECVQNGQFQAIKWYLENKGKHRGWRNTPEDKPPEQVKIEVIVVRPPALPEPRKQVESVEVETESEVGNNGEEKERET